MKRIVFLIDGFNRYHSTRDVAEVSGGIQVKWLDYHSLLSSYLSLLGPNAMLELIYYFTAFAKHLIRKDPEIVNRHKIHQLSDPFILKNGTKINKPSSW